MVLHMGATTANPGMPRTGSFAGCSLSSRVDNIRVIASQWERDQGTFEHVRVGRNEMVLEWQVSKAGA